MNFWASSESLAPADCNLERARQSVEPYIVSALNNSLLSNIDMLIRYVPIVMPIDMHERYPARSKSRIKQRIYDCAPHLEYEIFVTGNFEQQIKEYLRGIALSIPHLEKFGLSAPEIFAFKEIIENTSDSILEDRTIR